MSGNATSNPLLLYVTANKQDAVVYKAKTLFYTAGDDDIYAQSQAIEQIKTMLACLNDDILIEFYTKVIAQAIDIKQAVLAKAVKGVQEAERRRNDEQHVPEGDRAFPKWVNQDRIYSIGFDWLIDQVHPDNTGMYFHAGRGKIERLTNFVMKPIVQIISDDEFSRRRITEVSNGRQKHVFELPSAAFTSPVKFETILMDQGYYHYEEGFTQTQLNKIKSHYLGHYPTGYEITNLGWQDEGFFAFSNAIYHNGVKQYDEYGLVQVNEHKFLSMGASNILANLRKGTDSYKNDKHLRYVQSPIGFKQWTQLMVDVYGEKGMMGISWALLAVNRDIVSSRSNYCPIPYCYGAAQSGKSQFVTSIIALFLQTGTVKDMKLLNLNQVSIYAFWEYTSRFRNVPMGYNEFDVQAIPDAITKAFKGMAEGEGRVRGTGKKNKSETQEVNCLPILLGQYLATIDDGSILSRSLAEKFVENNNYTDEQVMRFNQLKAYEKAGISSLLVGILENRGLVVDSYLEAYFEVSTTLKSDFKAEGFTPKNRVVENYTVVLALMKLYTTRLEFAFTYEQFYIYCKAQIRNLNMIIGESNSLGEFWKILESISDRADGGIEPGWDYKVETLTELKSMIADKSSKHVISFDKPTRLLFMRLKNVYPPFAKEKRNITGKAAIPEDTIKTYLVDQPYYVGASAAGNFKSKKQGVTKNTSSYVFNYDMLMANGVNLLELEEDDPRTQVTLDGLVYADARLENNFGVEKLKFTLFKDESYFKDLLPVTKKTYTSCFTNDHSLVHKLKLGTEIKVTGLLSLVTRKDKVFRNMEVQRVDIIRALPADESIISKLQQDAEAAQPPATGSGTQLSIDQQFDVDHSKEDDDLPF